MWFSCPYIDRDGPHTYAIGENPSRTVNVRSAHPAVPFELNPSRGAVLALLRVPALPTSTSRLSVLSESGVGSWPSELARLHARAGTAGRSAYPRAQMSFVSTYEALFFL
jgi:hypothetical protein